MLAAAVGGVAVGEEEHQAAPLDPSDLLAGAGAVGAEARLPAGVGWRGHRAPPITAATAASGGAPRSTTPRPSPRRARADGSGSVVVVGRCRRQAVVVGSATPPTVRSPRWTWRRRTRRGRRRCTRRRGRQRDGQRPRARRIRRPPVGTVSRRLGGWPERVVLATPAAGCGRRWRSTATGGPPPRGRPRPRRPRTAGREVRCPLAGRRPRRPAVGAERGGEPADLVGHRLGVEGDRVGEEDGVGQAVRDAGAPADELRQPVVHAHAGVEQAAPGQRRALEHGGAGEGVAGVGDHGGQRASGSCARPASAMASASGVRCGE